MKKTATYLIVILVLTFMGAVAVRSGMQVLYPKRYADIVEKYSERYGVEENLIYAVIRTESSFDPSATSDVGAQGLMQIMPDTADWLCYRFGEDAHAVDLRDEDTAIRFGTYFLKLLQEQFGDTRTVLAAYHAGMGRVQGWLREPQYSPDGKTLQTIPFRDTAHYVDKVERAMQTYNNLYS